MVEEFVLPAVRALTVHLMSLFFFDSRVPFSTTVNGKRSYLTVNRTRCACPLKPLVMKLAARRPPPARMARMTTPRRTFARALHLRDFGGRRGLSFGDPCWVGLSALRAWGSGSA